MWMVLFRQRDHRVSVEGVRSGLVDRVPGDGGRGGARPIKNVPTSVVRQPLHRTNIYGTKNETTSKILMVLILVIMPHYSLTDVIKTHNWNVRDYKCTSSRSLNALEHVQTMCDLEHQKGTLEAHYKGSIRVSCNDVKHFNIYIDCKRTQR